MLLFLFILLEVEAFPIKLIFVSKQQFFFISDDDKVAAELVSDFNSAVGLLRVIKLGSVNSLVANENDFCMRLVNFY